MQIAWSEDLRTGNAEIDSQHMYLIEQANHIQKIITDGADASERRRVLHSLVSYIQLHFSCEEKLMNECNFPNKAAHIAEHAEFFQLIDIFLKRQQTAEEVTAIGLKHLFFNWFLDHIREYDCALVAYARNHAVSIRISSPTS